MNAEKRIDFKEEGFRDILAGWWRGLEGDTGGRAELRRAKRPDDVYVSRPFQAKLVRNLRGAGYQLSGAVMDRLATAAGLMSHVREGDDDRSQRVPEAMAASGPGGRARVSGLRFRRIVAIDDKDREGLYLEMLRLVRLLKKVNVLELAEAVYWWNDRVRKDWAVEYYSKAPQED
jgi:CRISPR system Cascade subunit CasB